MTTENIVVELVTPASGKAGAFTAGSGVAAKRIMQVTSGAPNVVVDGTTYTRTSPLRTTQLQGMQAPQLDALPAQDAWMPPVNGNASQGNQYTTPLPIFSSTGT